MLAKALGWRPIGLHRGEESEVWVEVSSEGGERGRDFWGVGCWADAGLLLHVFASIHGVKGELWLPVVTL